MSCSCNSSPCLCLPACLSDCPEIISYSAANINLAGVGTFDAQVLNEFQFRGIRSTNANLTVAFNAGLHTIDITLATATIEGTTQFANAATRANDVPNFVGQLGVQLDTDVLYIATGVGAGAWTGNFVQMDKTVTGTAAATTTLSIANHTVTFAGLGTGVVNFDNCSVNFTGLPTRFNAEVSVTGGGLLIDLNSYIDFIDATSRLKVLSVDIPANSVVITSATAGQVSSKLINTFISTSNTQAGWSVPSGTLDRGALAAYAGQVISAGYVQAEIQALDTAVKVASQHLAALITDIKAVKLPSA